MKSTPCRDGASPLLCDFYGTLRTATEWPTAINVGQRSSRLADAAVAAVGLARLDDTDAVRGGSAVDELAGRSADPVRQTSAAPLSRLSGCALPARSRQPLVLRSSLPRRLSQDAGLR